MNKFITYISSHQWAATSKWSVFEIGCRLVDWYALRAFPEGVEVSGNFHNLAFIPSFFKNSCNWLDCKVVLSSQPSRTISAPRGDAEEVGAEDEEVVGRIIAGGCCWGTNVYGGGNLCATCEEEDVESWCVGCPNFALIASVGEGFLELLFPLRS